MTTTEDTQTIGFRVTPDLYRRAQRLAKARNFQSVSELMRNLLREEVERNADRLETPEPALAEKGASK